MSPFPVMTAGDASDAEDPIVVIGMACRYPGQASSIEGFWDLVKDARSAHSKIPASRFNIDAYYHPSADRMGSIVTENGYFLEQDPATFDAPFFCMTATEAAGMDPMQRMMLEVAYECVENAGIPLKELSGSRTSVYVGCFTKDYEELSSRDILNTNFYQSTGNGRSMLSSRLSWFFDLLGPSMTLDTACSSSLYAVHLACQSLRLGESTMAIVGGTNLILAPDLMRALTAMRFLSPDGKCHSFDSRANGYARGEGIGAIVLKRLSQALADGDTIRAVIRASGLNQDGKTPGITMPSATAQAALIRSCYADAGLTFHQTAYFEAHGTGTAIGDPIELSALGETFGVDRDPAQPIYVSSAKTNIGHLEGCAGLAGLMRAVLAVEKGIIPPLADFVEANPMLRLDDWHIALPTTALDWPLAGIRRASVNSFGYGGANSHVIVDDAYHYLESRGLKGNHHTTVAQIRSDSDSGFDSSGPSSEEGSISFENEPKLFVFSALDQSALQRVCETYKTFLQTQLDRSKELQNEQEVDLDRLLENLAYTLSNRWSVFDHRAYIVANDAKDLVYQLQNRTTKSQRSEKPKSIAFVFTGQGAQWAAMGKQLISYDRFRSSLILAQDQLQALGCSWSIFEELKAEEGVSRINSPEFSQPICTALQLALVDLLASWDIRPSAVVGHSSGEIAAAYAAGFIAHETAMTIAFFRGVFSEDVQRRDLTFSGSMMAVGLSEVDVLPYLNDSSVVVACTNSPESVTLSGRFEELQALEKTFATENIFARLLKVKTAYHSPQMKLVAQDYEKALENVKTERPSGKVTMFSSVTATLISAEDIDASYWVKNMVQQVRFSDAVKEMLTHKLQGGRRRRATPNYSAIVEIGPHSALKGPLKQILGTVDSKIATNITYNSLLLRGEDSRLTALQAIGNLWTQGHIIGIFHVNKQAELLESLSSLPNLPSYPWNHANRFWHEMKSSKGRRNMQAPRTDLLGVLTESNNPQEPKWRNVIRTTENPWILDHKIQESVLYPGAAMLIMALEAAQSMIEKGRVVKGYNFRDITFIRGLIVPTAPGEYAETALHVRPHKIGTKAGTAPWFSFTVYSSTDTGAWNEHCAGLFSIEYQRDVSEVDHGLQTVAEWATQTAMYEDFKETCTTLLSSKKFYKRLSKIGLHYGPLFQNISGCTIGKDKSYATVTIPDTKSSMPNEHEYPHSLHPTTLDCIFQMLLGAMIETGDLRESMIPVCINNMLIASTLPNGAGSKFVGYSHGTKQGIRQAIGHLVMSDENWTEPKIVVDGFVSMGISAAVRGVVAMDASQNVRKKCTQLTWMEDIDYNSGTHHDTISSSELSTNVNEAATDVVEARVSGINTCLARILRHVSTSDMGLATVVDQDYLIWLQEEAATLKPSNESDQSATATDYAEIVAQFCNNFEKVLAGGMEVAEILSPQLDDLVSQAIDSELEPMTSELEWWLKLACHKNPNMSVLILEDYGRSSVQHIVRHFCSSQATGTDSFGSCVLAAGEDKIANVQRRLKGEKLNIEYKTLDLQQSISEQNFELGTFDLIIVSPRLQCGIKLETGLNSLKSLLNPCGRLVVHGLCFASREETLFYGISKGWWSENRISEAKADLTRTQWEQQLVQAGLSEPKLYLSATGHSLLLVSMLSNALKSSAEPNEVVILTGSEPPTDAVHLQQTLTEKLTSSGYIVSSAKLADVEDFAGKSVISLLEASEALINHWDESEFLQFRQAFTAARQILWITRGSQPMGCPNPQASLSTGLLRTLRAEYPQTSLSHLDISPSTDLAASSTAATVIRVFGRSVTGDTTDREPELIESEGRLYIPRLVEDSSFNKELDIPDRELTPVLESLVQQHRALRVAIGTPGMLDSLRWVEDIEAHAPMTGTQVEIRTAAMALNFVDIMAAMGQIPTSTVGCEISGTVIRVGPEVTRFKPGDVVLTTKTNAFRTHLRQLEYRVAHVPDGVPLEVAASLPTIFMTAYASLIDSARLQAGETILIHAAAGGLGQAAIQLAKNIGAEIYVTVGSQTKKELLMKHYEIPEDHIFNSRDLTFSKGVMRMTNGRGVDVILNSLHGEALRQSWLCIADFGRFIEVGKRDIVGNTGLDMSPFLRHVTFSSINLEHMDKVYPDGTGRLFRIVCELFQAGTIGQVYPTSVFNFSEMEKAFRTMQTGKHSGKVVLSLKDSDIVPILPEEPAQVQLDARATYVLSGGLGGIGRSIAEMMVRHGARHLIFLSRSGATNPESLRLITRLQNEGCKVDAIKCDISNSEQVADFAKSCQEQNWKVKGLIQCAMVLQDSTFEKMTFLQWLAATGPKVLGTQNLHDSLPRDLDFFIMLSSMSGVIGHAGQANYAAGNTYQDALAQYRRSHGETATCIDLGIVEDIGYIAEHSEQFEAKFEQLADLTISEQDLHQLLNAAMLGYTADGRRVPAQVVTGIGSALLNDITMGAAWMSDPKFVHLKNTGASDARMSSEGSEELRQAFALATSLREAGLVVQEALVAKLAKALLMEVTEVDTEKPLHAYGVDSLVAVEIRNWIFRELKANISVFDILSTLPLSKLSVKIAAESKYVTPALAAELNHKEEEEPVAAKQSLT